MQRAAVVRLDVAGRETGVPHAALRVEAHAAGGGERVRVLDRALRLDRVIAAVERRKPQRSGQERRVATRSLLPSGSSSPHSRPARPSSSTGVPNSFDTASMSVTYRWISVFGRASPLCSER